MSLWVHSVGEGSICIWVWVSFKGSHLTRFSRACSMSGTLVLRIQKWAWRGPYARGAFPGRSDILTPGTHYKCCDNATGSVWRASQRSGRAGRASRTFSTRDLKDKISFCHEDEGKGNDVVNSLNRDRFEKHSYDRGGETTLVPERGQRLFGAGHVCHLRNPNFVT